MKYIRLALAVSALSASALSQAPTIPPRLEHQWHKIANLPPGSPILVRQFYEPQPTPCILAWIDNTSVACDGVEGRLVYPASSLTSIASDTPPNPHPFPTGLAITTATGAVIGGLAGSNGSAGDTAWGVFIGAGLAGGFTAAVAPPAPHYMQPTPQWSMRIPLHSRHGRPWFR